MNYILIDSIDWADECDVHFGELIDEDLYNKYQYLNEKLGSFYGRYSFGTNEGWNGGFDFLGFDYKPITEEETAVLKKFGLPNGNDIICSLFSILTDVIIDNAFSEDIVLKESSWGNYKSLKFDLSNTDFKTFKHYIDKYADILKEYSDKNSEE